MAKSTEKLPISRDSAHRKIFSFDRTQHTMLKPVSDQTSFSSLKWFSREEILPTPLKNNYIIIQSQSGSLVQNKKVPFKVNRLSSSLNARRVSLPKLKFDEMGELRHQSGENLARKLQVCTKQGLNEDNLRLTVRVKNQQEIIEDLKSTMKTMAGKEKNRKEMLRDESLIVDSLRESLQELKKQMGDFLTSNQEQTYQALKDIEGFIVETRKKNISKGVLERVQRVDGLIKVMENDL